MIAKARLTLAEFLAMPEEKPYREYFDGEAVPKPMPNEDHARVVGELTFLWKLLAMTNSLLLAVGPEWRLTFPEAARVFLPDLFVTVINAGSGGARSGSNYPDLVVEVVSPEDRPSRLMEKVAVYLDAGITAWVIDPGHRTVTVFSPGHSPMEFGSGDSVPAAPVMPHQTISVDAIFATLPPK